jgi:hypothetical protein
MTKLALVVLAVVAISLVSVLPSTTATQPFSQPPSWCSQCTLTTLTGIMEQNTIDRPPEFPVPGGYTTCWVLQLNSGPDANYVILFNLPPNPSSFEGVASVTGYYNPWYGFWVLTIS